MKSNDNSEKQARMTVKIEFPELHRKYEVEGLVFFDYVTGAFSVEGENATMVHLPIRNAMTRKKRNRLKSILNFT